MNNFILIVVVAVVINTLVDLIISDGKMQKMIKSIVALFTFYMMVEGLISLLKTAKLL